MLDRLRRFATPVIFVGALAAAALVVSPLQIAFASVDADGTDQTPAPLVAPDEGRQNPLDMLGGAEEGTEEDDSVVAVAEELTVSTDLSQADDEKVDIGRDCFFDGSVPSSYQGPIEGVSISGSRSVVKLVRGRDFEVVGCVDAERNPVTEIVDYGTYTVTVRGIGAYTGEAYVLVEKRDDRDIGDVRCFLQSASKPCRGSVQDLEFIVYPRIGGNWLLKGRDYEIAGCVDAEGNPVTEIVEYGTYTVTLRGIGYYMGTRQIECRNWDERDIGNAIHYYEQSYVQHYGPTKDLALWLMLDEKALLNGRDFEIVECRDEAGNLVTEITETTAQGSYTIVCRGIGAYMGTLHTTYEYFALEPVGNFDGALTKILYLEYTGKSQSPEFEITVDDRPLKQGVDFTVKSVEKHVEPNSWVPISPDQCIEIGSYHFILAGVESRGYVGQCEVTLEICKVNDIRTAKVEGYDLKAKYDYTGQPIAIPDFTLTMPDGTRLVRGVDYHLVVDGEIYDDELPQCGKGGHSVQVVAWGELSPRPGLDVLRGVLWIGYFNVLDPDTSLSTAVISNVKIRYPFTGSSAATFIHPVVTLGSKELTVGLNDFDSDADCRIRVIYRLFSQVVYDLENVFFPGHYYMFVQGAGVRNGIEFYIYVEEEPGEVPVDAPVVTDDSTGVSASGSLFDSMAVDGNTVKLGVSSGIAVASTRAKSLLERHAQGSGALAKVFNVTLDLLSSAGERIAALTENLGNVALRFPVDVSLNGQRVRVIQLHENADGSIEEIERMAVVEGGQITIVVDKLSEFIIIPMGESADAGADTKKPVSYAPISSSEGLLDPDSNSTGSNDNDSAARTGDGGSVMPLVTMILALLALCIVRSRRRFGIEAEVTEES